jgi:hypothetical protein
MSRIACLCGRISQSVSLNQRPEQTILALCHCNSCRTTSGELCTSYFALSSPPTSFESLVEYQQSEHATRWFCKGCGAHVFMQFQSPSKFFVASGLLEAVPFETEAVEHACVNDTLDAGLSQFLPTIGSQVSTSWSGIAELSQQILPGEQPPSVGVPSQPNKEVKLPAKCHCGGVKFFITPPDESSKEASSPWSDLLVPYHSGSSENPNDVKWWLRAGDTKFLAGLCACNSCRLGAGFPIQSWAFVPKSNILKSDGSTLSYDMDTLQVYESSPGVYREFCNRCGATVFWHCDERPSVVDVSVGLLRANSGTLARGWLDWATERVSFAEDALDQKLIVGLEAGLQGWKRRQQE